MRVAVLFTGALRTIKKTMRYFKQNVLFDNVDVFACVQNDTGVGEVEWEQWLKQEMGGRLKHVEWFSLDKYSGWVSCRDRLIENMNLGDGWARYLRNSGSMIEYLQLYLAYNEMSKRERLDGIVYDYIIRSRTDTIFAKPVDFHWLNWSDADVAARIDLLSTQMAADGIDDEPENVFKYFMTTLLSLDLVSNIKNLYSNYLPSRDAIIPVGAAELNNYIKNGAYILTMRANNLYIVRRDRFYLVPSLAYIYGSLRCPYMDGHWFNAETQFRAACYNSGLSVFDYNTELEDNSLYGYDEKRYFDADYNLVNPCMVYCVVRY
jgi:hypothetical protein